MATCSPMDDDRRGAGAGHCAGDGDLESGQREGVALRHGSGLTSEPLASRCSPRSSTSDQMRSGAVAVDPAVVDLQHDHLATTGQIVGGADDGRHGAAQHGVQGAGVVERLAGADEQVRRLAHQRLQPAIEHARVQVAHLFHPSPFGCGVQRRAARGDRAVEGDALVFGEGALAAGGYRVGTMYRAAIGVPDAGNLDVLSEGALARRADIAAVRAGIAKPQYLRHPPLRARTIDMHFAIAEALDGGAAHLALPHILLRVVEAAPFLVEFELTFGEILRADASGAPCRSSWRCRGCR